MLALPYYLSQCINLITGGIESLLPMLLLFLALALGELCITVLVNDFNIVLSNKIAFQIEFDTVRHLKHVPYQTIRQHDDAYFAKRINNDAVVVADYWIERLPYFITNICVILCIVPLAFAIFISLGVLLLGFVAVFFAVHFLAKRLLYSRNRDMSEAQGSFFAMLSNQFLSMLVIKVNSWQKETDKEFVNVVSSFFLASIRYLRIAVTVAATNAFISRVAYGSAIIMLAAAVGQGKLSVGALSVVVIYVHLIMTKLESVTGWGVSREIYKVARDRLDELRRINFEHNGTLKLESVDTITVDQLSVSYCEQTILDNLNCSFEKGKIHVIIGENGAGKTTLVHALLGVVDFRGGNVFYNGNSIASVDLYHARQRHFAVSSQDPYINSGTLYNNIVYGLERKPDPATLPPFINALLDFAM